MKGSGEASRERFRYRFAKSKSKSFRDVLEYAQSMPSFRVDGDEYWVELEPNATPTAELRELERLSRKWKDSAHFIGDRRVTWETWWEELNPFGNKANANTSEDWIAKKTWLQWGRPENLVVGESYGNRQNLLRDLVDVDPSIPALRPVGVLFSRDRANKADKNAVKAMVDGLHIGFLPADRAKRIGPAMDRHGVSSMRVAGVISGSDLLGVHIWPDRRLSAGIAIDDSTRIEPAKFHPYPETAFETYEAARLSSRPAPQKSPMTAAAITPPAASQVRYDDYAPIVQKIQKEQIRETATWSSGCGAVCLLIAAPYLLKHGIDTVMGLNFLIFGCVGLLVGLGAWMKGV